MANPAITCLLNIPGPGRLEPDFIIALVQGLAVKEIDDGIDGRDLILLLWVEL